MMKIKSITFAGDEGRTAKISRVVRTDDTHMVLVSLTVPSLSGATLRAREIHDHTCAKVLSAMLDAHLHFGNALRELSVHSDISIEVCEFCDELLTGGEWSGGYDLVDREGRFCDTSQPAVPASPLSDADAAEMDQATREALEGNDLTAEDAEPAESVVNADALLAAMAAAEKRGFVGRLEWLPTAGEREQPKRCYKCGAPMKIDCDDGRVISYDGEGREVKRESDGLTYWLECPACENKFPGLPGMRLDDLVYLYNYTAECQSDIGLARAIRELKALDPDPTRAEGMITRKQDPNPTPGPMLKSALKVYINLGLSRELGRGYSLEAAIQNAAERGHSVSMDSFLQCNSRIEADSIYWTNHPVNGVNAVAKLPAAKPAASHKMHVVGTPGDVEACWKCGGDMAFGLQEVDGKIQPSVACQSEDCNIEVLYPADTPMSECFDHYNNTAKCKRFESPTADLSGKQVVHSEPCEKCGCTYFVLLGRWSEFVRCLNCRRTELTHTEANPHGEPETPAKPEPDPEINGVRIKPCECGSTNFVFPLPYTSEAHTVHARCFVCGKRAEEVERAVESTKAPAKPEAKRFYDQELTLPLDGPPFSAIDVAPDSSDGKHFEPCPICKCTHIIRMPCGTDGKSHRRSCRSCDWGFNYSVAGCWPEYVRMHWNWLCGHLASAKKWLPTAKVDVAVAAVELSPVVRMSERPSFYCILLVLGAVIFMAGGGVGCAIMQAFLESKGSF